MITAQLSCSEKSKKWLRASWTCYFLWGYINGSLKQIMNISEELLQRLVRTAMERENNAFCMQNSDETPQLHFADCYTVHHFDPSQPETFGRRVSPSGESRSATFREQWLHFKACALDCKTRCILWFSIYNSQRFQPWISKYNSTEI